LVTPIKAVGQGVNHDVVKAGRQIVEGKGIDSVVGAVQVALEKPLVGCARADAAVPQVGAGEVQRHPGGGRTGLVFEDDAILGSVAADVVVVGLRIQRKTGDIARG